MRKRKWGRFTHKTIHPHRTKCESAWRLYKCTMHKTFSDSFATRSENKFQTLSVIKEKKIYSLRRLLKDTRLTSGLYEQQISSGTVLLHIEQLRPSYSRDKSLAGWALEMGWKWWRREMSLPMPGIEPRGVVGRSTDWAVPALFGRAATLQREEQRLHSALCEAPHTCCNLGMLSVREQTAREATGKY
jgi:hypothetical protein